LAGVTSRVAQSVACLYTVTPDRGFIIDWHPRQDRVLAVSACSGHGFKHSAGIGNLAAGLLTDGRSHLNTTAFSLARFQN
jgi:sarcosine oxidase